MRRTWTPIKSEREVVSISAAFSRIADLAKMDNRPPPIITTDLSTAVAFAHMIDDDIGYFCRTGTYPLIAMFDGVEIHAAVPPAPPLTVAELRDLAAKEGGRQFDAWREHFGVWAEIELEEMFG